MEVDLQKEFDSLNQKSSLEELQEYARKMIIARGFEGETPQDILMLLTEELGELAKEVRKTTKVKMLIEHLIWATKLQMFSIIC